MTRSFDNAVSKWAGADESSTAPTPIGAAFASLSGALNNLAAAEDCLATQLEPVRLTVPEKVEVGNAPREVPNHCMLESKIHGAIEQIQNITAHLNRVREELRL